MEARRVLLLASYCGVGAGCTDDLPCLECLKMSNIVTIAGEITDNLGGWDSNRADARLSEGPDGDDRAMTDPIICALARRLNAAGLPCGPRLLARYAEQVALTGKKTTSADTYGAWLRWIGDEGGEPSPDVTQRLFDLRVAVVIREVARYS